MEITISNHYFENRTKLTLREKVIGISKERKLEGLNEQIIGEIIAPFTEEMQSNKGLYLFTLPLRKESGRKFLFLISSNRNNCYKLITSLNSATEFTKFKSIEKDNRIEIKDVYIEELIQYFNPSLKPSNAEVRILKEIKDSKILVKQKEKERLERELITFSIPESKKIPVLRNTIKKVNKKSIMPKTPKNKKPISNKYKKLMNKTTSKKVNSNKNISIQKTGLNLVPKMTKEEINKKEQLVKQQELKVKEDKQKTLLKEAKQIQRKEFYTVFLGITNEDAIIYVISLLKALKKANIHFELTDIVDIKYVSYLSKLINYNSESFESNNELLNLLSVSKKTQKILTS